MLVNVSLIISHCRARAPPWRRSTASEMFECIERSCQREHDHKFRLRVDKIPSSERFPIFAFVKTWFFLFQFCPNMFSSHETYPIIKLRECLRIKKMWVAVGWWGVCWTEGERTVGRAAVGWWLVEVGRGGKEGVVGVGWRWEEAAEWEEGGRAVEGRGARRGGVE